MPKMRISGKYVYLVYTVLNCIQIHMIFQLDYKDLSFITLLRNGSSYGVKGLVHTNRFQLSPWSALLVVG